MSIPPDRLSPIRRTRRPGFCIGLASRRSQSVCVHPPGRARKGGMVYRRFPPKATARTKVVSLPSPRWVAFDRQPMDKQID